MSKPPARRALLLVNRHARQGKTAAQQIGPTLRELGLELIEQPSPKPDRVGEVIRKHRGQVDLVIIAGGDGSLNAAADVLVETQLPLAVVPMGTANDLAHTLGLPLDVAGACRVIAEGELKAIDLGHVNGKHFFNVASLGLAVKITEKLSGEKKSRWGVLAYLLTAMKVVIGARPFVATIQHDQESLAVRTVQISVGNGRYYGGRLTVDEHATIDDGLLNLYSLEINHWWQIISLLPAMWRGTLRNSPRARTLTGREFRITTRRPRRVNTDGELTTHTPTTFKVVPKAIRVCVPVKGPGDAAAGLSDRH